MSLLVAAPAAALACQDQNDGMVLLALIVGAGIVLVSAVVTQMLIRRR